MEMRGGVSEKDIQKQRAHPEKAANWMKKKELRYVEKKEGEKEQKTMISSKLLDYSKLFY